jgi:DNA polymerase III gamma/tau subunit
LARAAVGFSEEDLTRFFQILLLTEDDLRRKPDPRLHLEMGLLRLVNAARLAPLEEVLAELSGNVPARASGPRLNANANASAHAAPESSSAPVSDHSNAPIPVSAAPPPIRNVSADSNSGAASAVAPALERDANPSSVSSIAGLEAAQVDAIKAESFAQTQFLGELVESAVRWELEAGEIRLYFPNERRALADLLQSRDRIEKLRTIASRVLGQQVRVCVRLEASPVLASRVRAGETGRELRARFEQDPIVRAMLERFGGRISEVKRRDEG